jgi:hypothetical protein
MGVVEAKLRVTNVDQVVKRSFPSHWSVLHNAGSGHVARIVLAWDAQLLTVDLVFSAPQLIVVKVLLEDNRVFFVSFLVCTVII